MKKISIIFISIILCGLVRFYIYAEPLPGVGSSVGGSNYVMISIGNYKNTCSEEDWFGIVSTGKLSEVKPVIAFYDSNMQTVRNQLETMYSNGQRKISLVLWTQRFDDNNPEYSGKNIYGHRIRSNGGNLPLQYQENIKNLIVDIKNAGFNEVIFRFALQDQNYPLVWESWNESLYQENLDIILNTRKIVNWAWCGNQTTCNGTGLLYDLGLELGGTLPKQGLPYTKKLWEIYTSMFGKSDTIGFSYIGQGSNVVNRVKASIDMYDSTPAGRPNVYAFDIYADPENNFININDTLVQKGDTITPFIILESFYNDVQERDALNLAITKTGRKVLFLMQWPKERGSVCSRGTVDYPKDYSNYLQAGYWKFDEGFGTTTVDSSGNNNVGNLINSPSWTIGRVNKALQFGGNNYVQISNSTNLNPASITIGAWIRPSQATYGNIISKGGNSGYRFRINADGTITFYDRGATNRIQTTETIPLSQWTYVAVVGNGSGLKIYINGKLSTSNSVAYGSPNNTSTLKIGAEPAFSEYFKGIIDEVKIWNYALTSQEILNEYNSAPVKICTPNWQCTSWSTCANSQQTRSCTDLSSCGVTNSKPTETQSCTATCTPNCINIQCGANGCGGTCGSCSSNQICNTSGQCITSPTPTPAPTPPSGGGGSISTPIPTTPIIPITQMTREQLVTEVNRIIALITQLQAQLTQLKGTTVVTYQPFTTNLYYGMTNNPEVKRLQEFLINNGYMKKGYSTGNYLSPTVNAVKYYQRLKGITPMSGYFGPKTMNSVNAEIGVK